MDYFIENFDSKYYLDNNPDEYKKKYESIFFKNEQLPDEFNTEKIKEKINNVLNSI